MDLQHSNTVGGGDTLTRQYTIDASGNVVPRKKIQVHVRRPSRLSKIIAMQREVHPDEPPWKQKILDFIHHPTTQMVLMLLLLLDVGLVVTESILAEHKSCDVSVNPLFSSCPYIEMNKYHETFGPMDCHKMHHQVSHSIEEGIHVLEYLSITIVCIFLFENVVLMALLHKEYFTHPLMVSDLLVMIVTVVLFFVLHGNETFVELIVLVRVWRLVRILHGFGMSVHEVDEEAVKEEEKKIVNLEQEIKVLKSQSSNEPIFETDEYKTMFRRAASLQEQVERLRRENEELRARTAEAQAKK